MLNGMLTGIIAQCAGCDRYIPAFSAIIGVMGGLVYLLGHKSMVLLKLDDPLDAVAVHAGGGEKTLNLLIMRFFQLFCLVDVSIYNSNIFVMYSFQVFLVFS